MKYEVYEEVDEVPENQHTVDTKWVYRLKKNPDGSTKWKARLTGRGYTQLPGLHYDRTDGPTARTETSRSTMNYRTILQGTTSLNITVVSDASYAPNGSRSHTGTTTLIGNTHI
jgi:hypothetical protein